ncbi:MAG: urea amidolyase associated protein UAAP1 [Acidimicrobiales bacterium]
MEAPGNEPDSSEADTSSPRAAREHARAQEGLHHHGMPTMPATAATGLPTDIPTDALLWDEVLDPGGYTAHRLPRGTHLRLEDTAGEGCAHLIVHNARQTSERLNPADTVKVQWQAYLTEGSHLLSDMARSLLTVVEDTSGHHDAFCSAPNRADHQRKYGDGSNEGPTPSARDRLVLGALKFGLQRRDVGPSISFFKGVTVAPDGTLSLDTSTPPLTAHVVLRCDMDVHVVVANTPHVLDERPGWVCSSLRATAWTPQSWASTSPDALSPEAARAMLNTQDWLAGVGPS